MIDKNGKLFGKINIIDLLIILIVIAAIAFFALKLSGGDSGGSTTETSTVRLVFRTESSPTAAAEVIKSGDPAYEDSTNIGLGKVVSVESEQAYEYSVDASGNLVKVPTPEYSIIVVTTELEGELADDGLRVNGSLYSVGASCSVHFGQAKLYGYIYSFEAVD